MQTTDTIVLDPRNRCSLVQPMQPTRPIDTIAGCSPLKAPQQTQSVRMRAPTENQVNAKAPVVSTCPYTQYHPKRSSKVRKIDKVYVGLLLELPPPVEVQVKWNIDVRGYLEEDLCQATRQLPQHLADKDVVIELDLCMAGKKLSKSDRAQLMQTESIKDPLKMKPTVWIRCGSKKCKNKVDETIAKLSYLHQFIRHFNLDPPHSSLHAPWPAASETAPDTSPLDDGRQIFFDIERGDDKNRICGAKARFRLEIGRVSTTICSTIGGMVTVDNRLYALTTAHGIVNHILSLEHGLGTKDLGHAKEEEDEEDSEGSSDCESDNSSSSGSETTQYYSTTAPKAATKDAWNFSQDDVHWMRLPLPKVLKYLHHGTAVGDYSLPNPSTSTTSSQADFVLIDIEAAGLPTGPNAIGRRGLMSLINDHMPAWDLAEGMVDIITSRHGRHVSGYLLRGDTSIILRGTVIRTKKIQIHYANAAGISGAWVVRHNKLCGIVYAAYDESPYLHMLPAETVFQEIGAWMQASKPVRVAKEGDYSLAPQGSAGVSKIFGALRAVLRLTNNNIGGHSELPSGAELIASARPYHRYPSELSKARPIHVLPQAPPPQSFNALLGNLHPPFDPIVTPRQRYNTKLVSNYTSTDMIPSQRCQNEPPKRCPTCSALYDPASMIIVNRQQIPSKDAADPLAQNLEYEGSPEDPYERWKQLHAKCSAPPAEDSSGEQSGKQRGQRAVLRLL